MDDLSTKTDSEKLIFLAQWFDAKYPDNPDNDVQEDLRAMADRIAALEAENADLKAQLSDIAEAHAQVLSEKCPTDEVHCTCVPYLRQEIKDLRETIAALEDKCLGMEGQKVKVMEQLSELREAVRTRFDGIINGAGPLRRCV